MCRKEDKKISVSNIAKIIICIICIFLLLIGISVIYKANKYPDKVPDIFGYKPMIVLSGSMETAIYKGDLAVVKVVDANTLKANDIIAFRNESNTITTHRIIEVINEDGKVSFRTKGDNNNAQDMNLVETKDLEGLYIFKIPRLGNVLMFLKEPQSLAIILLTILLIGLFWIYITDKKEAKKENFK